LIRDVETTAAAGQLERDINGWLLLNKDALKIARVAEIRGLTDVAKTYKAKLQTMQKKTQQVQLTNVLVEVNTFQGELDSALSSIMIRGSNIWESKIQSGTDLENLAQELDKLNAMFEGCENDLNDFQMLRRVLKDYERVYRQLQDETLSGKELDSTISKCKAELESTYGEKDIPWKAGETLSSLIVQIITSRNERSSDWIRNMELAIHEVDKLSVAEANRLYDRASNPPALLKDEDAVHLLGLKQRIEDRLKSLALDWLIEKFVDLPIDSKRKFIQMATQKMGE
jgi:hypothetical protein